jgi:hypothetical protein
MDNVRDKRCPRCGSFTLDGDYRRLKCLRIDCGWSEPAKDRCTVCQGGLEEEEEGENGYYCTNCGLKYKFVTSHF